MFDLCLLVQSEVNLTNAKNLKWHKKIYHTTNWKHNIPALQLALILNFNHLSNNFTVTWIAVKQN